MKHITRIGLYFSLISPALLLLACGTEKIDETASYENKMGQTENTLKEVMPTASVDNDLALNTMSDNFYASLPYYCDPNNYPQHMIRSIAVCIPFLSQLWGTSYGYYRYLPRFLDRTGYRIKHHVGRVSKDEDWDDRYDRDNKKHHKKHKKDEEDNNGPGFRHRGARP